MALSLTELETEQLIEALENGGDSARFHDLLRRANLLDFPAAWANLVRLFESFLGEQFAALLPQVLGELSRAADPDRALRNLARFIGQSFNPFGFGRRLRGSEDLLRFLVQTFGFSQFLSDILIRNPEYLDWLRTPGVLERPKLLAHYELELEQASEIFIDPQRRRDAICRYQRKELLRIGVRDLLNLGTLSERTAELSDLAEAIVNRVATECQRRLEERHGKPISEEINGRESVFGIVAMGKLGGRELNFSSDIDLIFFYSDEGTAIGINGERRISNHQFFTRLGEDVISELSRYSEEGFLYRVDMRLRPDGETGPLVRSLVSIETYYLTQARNWERLAMSKARVVHGGETLAKPFQSLADHFVYGSALGKEIFSELANLKAQIDNQVVLKGHGGREVKRGVGGIREIEFIVGAMQLLHGRSHRELRVRSTLTALAVLEEAQILPPQECRHLRDSYIFLRNVEHRLQMLNLAQTHTLPQAESELHQLALRCGFEGNHRHSPVKQFTDAYSEQTRGVHEIFLRFFGQSATPKSEAGLSVLLNANADPAERFGALQPYRFTETSILATFDALARGHRDFYLSAEGQQFFEFILPRFLEECAKTPMPEQAVRMFDQFLLRLKGITATYAFIAEQPLALRILLHIFGTSEYLGRILLGHPEFLDVLLDPGTLTEPPSPELLKKRAMRLVNERSRGALQAALCRFKETECLAAGARQFENLVPPKTTALTLSYLADACLEAAVEAAARELAASEGLAQTPTGLAVLAMGKLGILEMNFFSDLDLVFVHGEAPEGVHDLSGFYTRWAQRVVAIVSEVTPAGSLFKIDARLRPEGKNAPLVASLDRYFDYYANRAQPWEFQSFVRSRHVAGDAALSEALRHGVLQEMKRLSDRVDLGAEIRAMRQRVDQSVRLPSGVLTDFKRSRGGIVDLEFILQYLQLRGVKADESIFTPIFHDALERLQACGLIGEANANTLDRNYRFLRLLETRTRLLLSNASSYLPNKRERLAPLEFLMRDAVPENRTLTDFVSQTMSENRKLFEELVK